ncbi:MULTISPECIES: phosphotransferase enzyme family protein [Roseobacteraceae]|nr:MULTISPECIES: phosphotransferase [Roseobacteraceae]
MSDIAKQALAFWGMQDAPLRLIAARENQVFRVDYSNAAYALRLHRPGYRTDAELRSELKWMGAVDAGGLHVPTPIAGLSGDYLHRVDGVQIDLLSWLSGAPIGETGAALDHADPPALFQALGREMARLHTVSDAWTLPPGFTRCAWDQAALLGNDPLWGRFWENPSLTQSHVELLQAARAKASARLATTSSTLDYGLIHADLVRENVMQDGDRLQLIDFDDSGFGYRLFDIATTLLKNLSEPGYDDLKTALLDGYRSVRPINTTDLDLFLLLRALTYVGWIVPRMNEDGSDIRNRRFIETATRLAQNYLTTP